MRLAINYSLLDGDFPSDPGVENLPFKAGDWVNPDGDTRILIAGQLNLGDSPTRKPVLH